VAAVDYAEDAAHFELLLGLIAQLVEDEMAIIAREISKRQRAATLADLAAVFETGRKSFDPALIWERLRELLSPAQAGAAVGLVIGNAVERTVEVTGPPMTAFTVGRTGVDLDFEDIAESARLWAVAQSRNLIAEMSAAQPGLLRAMLDLIAAEDLDPVDAARLIRGALGLSASQAQALFNANQDWMAMQAAGKITTTKRRQLLATYRERLIAHRSERLAKDWVARAANEGQRRIWTGMATAAPELASAWERRSVGILSGNICPYCYERHGWRAPIGGAYEDGSNGPPWPHAAGGGTYGCRCTEELVEVGSSEDGKPPFITPSGGGSLRPMV